MCTAITLYHENAYFGRTLDLDCSYGEQICIMPRRYPLVFTERGVMSQHFAMIGMATVMNGVPLYYDACNEYGLCMAGLNFPNNAYYAPVTVGKDNIAPARLIPWVLSQCKTVGDAKRILGKLNLADIAFAPDVPPAPLHFMIADKEGSIVLESTKDGLFVHDNPVGVMTNNPLFEQQLENLAKYGHLRVDNGDIQVSAEAYCQGLGAVGLPGDLSSMSRFVRAAFFRANAVCEGDERAAVGQFFHILDTVKMPKGACLTDHGTWDYTVYTSCMNMNTGVYYYTTYESRQIHAVSLHAADLEAAKLSLFPLIREEEIKKQNQNNQGG